MTNNDDRGSAARTSIARSAAPTAGPATTALGYRTGSTMITRISSHGAHCAHGAHSALEAIVRAVTRTTVAADKHAARRVAHLEFSLLRSGPVRRRRLRRHLGLALRVERVTSAMAAASVPGPDEPDPTVAAFLRDGGTLYLIGRKHPVSRSQR